MNGRLTLSACSRDPETVGFICRFRRAMERHYGVYKNTQQLIICFD